MVPLFGLVVVFNAKLFDQSYLTCIDVLVHVKAFQCAAAPVLHMKKCLVLKAFFLVQHRKLKATDKNIHHLLHCWETHSKKQTRAKQRQSCAI